ncbi:hypothetical protein [Pantoea agglomerans]
MNNGNSLVQRHVTEDYSPVSAREKLITLFESHPSAVEAIKSLSKRQVCVLAALLDHKSFTTWGYNIPADYGVNRASSVAHALDKIHSFPISSRLIDTETEGGSMTKQARFYISEEDYVRLLENPEQVFKERRDNACRIRGSQAQKEIARLVKEYGKEGVLELLTSVANDEFGPSNS